MCHAPCPLWLPFSCRLTAIRGDGSLACAVEGSSGAEALGFVFIHALMRQPVVTLMRRESQSSNG